MKLKTIGFLFLATLPLGVVSTVVQAHHGFGLFQLDKHVHYSGTLTKMELVNPHSYMYFDTVDSDGKPLSMRCEMRAATLIKRSGWSTDMFKPGAHVELDGNPHRDDPHACYLETFSLNDAEEINRNDQFSTNQPVDISNRPARLASGELNISGDWAVEQLVLTVPPSGGNGSMVPRSKRAAYAAGEITDEELRALNPPRVTPVYTEKGQQAATAYRRNSTEDNPLLTCKPTSIISDWTYDWPLNQIIQKVTANGEKVIDMNYGLLSLYRRIHMDSKHPVKVPRSDSGHSIGHWEGDTLIVDTIGFTEGLLSPPIYRSEQLHLVERYTLNTDTMALRRTYTATDPVYLVEPYTTYDEVYLSEVPYEAQTCKELTPEFNN